MGSQFVDLDGDGHIDLVTATFDGTPHVAFGSKDGFRKPQHLLDRNGARLRISSIWDYDQETHTDLEPVGIEDGKGERCVSALAYDWDGDGDHDVLLGSYENGHLYVQENQGTDEEPLYSGVNRQVLAGEVPFALDAKLTAPVLVDWDGDGDRDLVAGSFGESFTTEGKGGGVYLSLNEGGEGAPRFGPLQVLVPPSAKDAQDAVRPDAGLYPTVADVDGDGDLDLVVGGYSLWKPPGRTLTAAEQAKVAELEGLLEEAQAALAAFNERFAKAVDEALAGLDPDSDAHDAKFEELWLAFEDEREEVYGAIGEVQDQLEEYVPRAKRKTFVWLYERL